MLLDMYINARVRSMKRRGMQNFDLLLTLSLEKTRRANNAMETKHIGTAKL